ncbi:hypothetical protein K0M31_018354 [Melipona bicolor]|uniref:Uncharacterized protein n=1 Tax=Melipona bicolor TaxID=60889 RepID=A0AA40G3X4_9HYME|nr:hypothetical protein K0M31_018354 [Melipona bicolor]
MVSDFENGRGLRERRCRVLEENLQKLELDKPAGPKKQFCPSPWGKLVEVRIG